MQWIYRGPAIGMTFMTFFGAAWLSIPLQNGAASISWLVLFAVGGVVLVVCCIVLFRLAAKTPPGPRGGSASDFKAMGKRIGISFGIIFGAETVLIVAVANILPAVGLEPLTVPVIAIIVGVHFLPLAGLFKAKVYYLTGIVSVLVGLGSISISSETLRQDFVGYGMCIVLWLTSFAVFSYARNIRIETPRQ